MRRWRVEACALLVARSVRQHTATVGDPKPRVFAAERSKENSTAWTLQPGTVSRLPLSSRSREATSHKPIAPVYTAQHAQRVAEAHHWTMGPDGAGQRRLVASPRPLRVLGIDPSRWLLEHRSLVIAAGGGGVPVTLGEDGHGLQGASTPSSTRTSAAGCWRSSWAPTAWSLRRTSLRCFSVGEGLSNARSARPHRRNWPGIRSTPGRCVRRCSRRVPSRRLLAIAQSSVRSIVNGLHRARYSKSNSMCSVTHGRRR